MSVEKKTKKKAEVTEDAVAGNIANLPELTEEFKKGKMTDRKLVSLRLRLVQLCKSKLITEDEQELMETILRRQRRKGEIDSEDEYLLNEIERVRCEEKCIVKTDDVPQTHFLKKGLVCDFMRDDEAGRFVVYIPRTVPSNHQYSDELAQKILLGHPIEPGEIPKPRQLIVRKSLTDKEFDRWFDVQEDLLDGKGKAPIETEYQF